MAAKLTTVGGSLWLVHHDARRLGAHGKFHDVGVGRGVDAAAVALTLLCNNQSINQLQCGSAANTHIRAVRLPENEQHVFMMVLTAMGEKIYSCVRANERAVQRVTEQKEMKLTGVRRRNCAVG